MVGRWVSVGLRDANAASAVIRVQQNQGRDTFLLWFSGLRCCDCNQTPLSPLLFVCLQVCHHPDCLDLNSKSPLHLCESCDSRCHSENSDNMHFDRHPRFDLQPQGRVSGLVLFLLYILLYYRLITAKVKRCSFIIIY